MKINLLRLCLLICIFFFSCQKEENILLQNTQNKTLKANDPLTGLLLRVSQNPTGFDNVLDDSSCFTVKLPVNIIVNSQSISVASEVDFATVQNIKDTLPGDDIVNFTFPITIIYQNSQEQIITSATQFNQIKTACLQEDDGFEELSCIQFNFPIQINLFNSNSQLANTLVFNSDINLFNFLNNLNPNDLYEIKFPISVQDSNNQNVILNNNNQLVQFIEDNIDECNGTTSGVISPTFIPTITSGLWRVSYFFDDDDEETNDFITYTFAFNTNNTITVNNAGTITNGTWNVVVVSGVVQFNLTFEDSNLSGFAKSWKLIEFNANNIHLRDINNIDSYLFFSKI